MIYQMESTNSSLKEQWAIKKVMSSVFTFKSTLTSRVIREMSLDESYILQRMEQIMKDSYCMWDIHDYIELRNLVCARLTMFNARRGGEPARMTLQEWLDADSEAWIDKDLVENISDPFEQDLLETFKLA